MLYLRVFLGLLLSYLLATQAWSETLRMGFFEVPPFCFEDKQTLQPSGATIEFFEQEIAPRLGVTIHWISGGMVRQMTMIERKQVDGIIMMAKTPQRQALLKFPEQHYMQIHSRLAVLKSSPLTQVRQVEDLLGLTIGYAQNSYLTPFMRDPRIKYNLVYGASWVIQNVRMLQRGRVDAVYLPTTAPVLYVAKEYGFADELRFVEIPSHATPVYSPFVRNDGREEQLARRYDQAFVASGGTQTYLKYLAKYIDITRL